MIKLVTFRNLTAKKKKTTETSRHKECMFPCVQLFSLTVCLAGLRISTETRLDAGPFLNPISALF